MLDLTRHEAATALNLHRANARLKEAQKVIDGQEELLHRRAQQRVDHTLLAAKGREAPSSIVERGRPHG